MRLTPGEIVAKTISREALGAAHSIRQLPLDDQRRVLRLVELMLVARDEARLRAQSMIREIVTADADAGDQRVASIDETIRYLEQHPEPSRLI